MALLHFVLGLARIELVVADLRALAPDSILARDSTNPSACGSAHIIKDRRKVGPDYAARTVRHNALSGRRASQSSELTAKK